jgi:hypothetical protein
MKVLIFLIFLSLNYQIYSQRDVSITINGFGQSKDEAIQNAIDFSVNRIFRVFYSSNKDFHKDTIEKVENWKVDNGTIKKIDVISSERLSNEKWFVNLSLLISLDDVEKFFKTTSQNIKYEGTVYTYNILNQELKEINEYKSVVNLLEVGNEYLLKAFSFDLKIGNPISIDDISEKWMIQFNVKTKINSNISLFQKLLIDNLRLLNMPESEIIEYENSGKKVYPIKLFNETIYLRNKYTQETINNFINLWSGYVRSFDIKSKFKFIRGNKILPPDEAEIKFSNSQFLNSISINDFNLLEDIPNSNAIYGDFDFFVEFKFDEIEPLNGFKIYPNNLLQFKKGGYVIQDTSGHGLVLSPFSISYFDEYKKNIKPKIDDYINWKVPTFEEFQLINQNLFLNQISYFDMGWGENDYLTSTQGILSIISVRFYSLKTKQLSENQTAFIKSVVFVKKY